MYESALLLVRKSVCSHPNLNKNNISGHWFHFAERVLPMLTPAYDQVWGPDGIVPTEQRDEIYIVFAEENSATSLGPFGRFFLTSILTGGTYKSVHICSATSILYHTSGLNVTRDERSLVEGLKIHFTIDLRQQSIRDLFIKNAQSNQYGKETYKTKPKCWFAARQ